VISHFRFMPRIIGARRGKSIPAAVRAPVAGVA
jgi:hypothetical protein